MKRSIKVASIVLAVIIVLTIGIVLYGNGTFVSAEQLHTRGFVSTEFKNYVADFYRSENEVFEVSVQLGIMDPEFPIVSMYVYFSNHSGTLDSLSLGFAAQGVAGFIQCYFESPASVPATVTTPDGQNTIVQVNDPGKMGTSSFYLEFLVVPLLQANNFEFQVKFTLLSSGFPLTRQAGSTQTELPLTFANAT